jgi:predicted metal-dependent enzyme (double-stranded beta helix superfamily)
VAADAGFVENLVERVRTAAASKSPVMTVQRVLEETLEDPTAVVESLGTMFDPRTFNVLHRDDRLTISHFLLPPGYRTGPHEHRMWAVTGTCSGTEHCVLFRRVGRTIERTGERAIGPGEVSALGSGAIHESCAGMDEALSAIHVYGGDLAIERSAWETTSLKERPYDGAAEIRRQIAALRAADLVAP